ncbi:MAG: DUF4388 domain-containing protein [Deltaproteobacteria bacterium]|nr:DUF4388 domain-containing protein [Deltaproteobacteria bacterium]
MGRLEGDLDAMSLADVVIWLANRSMTGDLVVQRGGVTRRFRTEDGILTRVASNDPREYFGQFLVHFGLLTDDQLRRAFETQGSTNVLLGRILVMIGIVPENQISQTLKVKMSESMLDALRWTRGRFAFDTTAPSETRPEVDVRIPLHEIHTEASLRTDFWASLSRIFPSGSTVLGVNENNIPPLAAETLDGKIIAAARHGCTVDDLLLGLNATDYLIMSRLFGLQQAGTIEARTPSNPSGRSLPPVDLMRGLGDLSDRTLRDADFHGANQLAYAIAQRGYQTAAPKVPAYANRNTEPEPMSRELVPKLTNGSTGEPAAAQSNMTPKERYILARIDGERTVQGIIQISPMQDIEAMRIIKSLEAQGLVQF